MEEIAYAELAADRIQPAVAFRRAGVGNVTIGDLRCDRPFFIEVIAKPEPANRHRFNVAAKNILSVGVGIMVKTAATHLDVGHPFRIGTLHEVPADEKVPADKIGGWTFEELAAHSFHQELEVAAEQSAAGQVRDHIAQAQALQSVVKSGPIVAVEPRIPERARQELDFPSTFFVWKAGNCDLPGGAGRDDRVRAELMGTEKAQMAWAPIPLAIYGAALPSGIRSSWVFVLRSGATTGAERHPNSHQRMMSFEAIGEFASSSRTGGRRRRSVAIQSFGE